MREANRAARPFGGVAPQQMSFAEAKQPRRTSSIFTTVAAGIRQRSEACGSLTRPSQADSTSQMLLTLLAVLLVTEMPQGVLTLLMG